MRALLLLLAVAAHAERVEFAKGWSADLPARDSLRGASEVPGEGGPAARCEWSSWAGAKRLQGLHGACRSALAPDAHAAAVAAELGFTVGACRPSRQAGTDGWACELAPSGATKAYAGRLLALPADFGSVLLLHTWGRNYRHGPDHWRRFASSLRRGGGPSPALEPTPPLYDRNGPTRPPVGYP